MSPRSTERFQRQRAQKQALAASRLKSGETQRVVAERLEVVRSHVEALESDDGAKHLRVSDVPALCEEMQTDQIQWILDQSGNRHVLVRASEDSLCPSTAEALHAIAGDFSQLLLTMTGAQLDGRVDRGESLRIREALHVARRALARLEAGNDALLARDAEEARRAVGLAGELRVTRPLAARKHTA